MLLILPLLHGCLGSGGGSTTSSSTTSYVRLVNTTNDTLDMVTTSTKLANSITNGNTEQLRFTDSRHLHDPTGEQRNNSPLTDNELFLFLDGVLHPAGLYIVRKSVSDRFYRQSVDPHFRLWADSHRRLRDRCWKPGCIYGSARNEPG